MCQKPNGWWGLGPGKKSLTPRSNDVIAAKNGNLGRPCNSQRIRCLSYASMNLNYLEMNVFWERGFNKKWWFGRGFGFWEKSPLDHMMPSPEICVIGNTYISDMQKDALAKKECWRTIGPRHVTYAKYRLDYIQLLYLDHLNVYKGAHVTLAS